MQKKESSSQSGCQREANVSLMSTRSLKQEKGVHRTPLSPATAECQVENSETTLQDKSLQCEHPSKKKKSSKILVQASTTSERVFSQFYDESCRGISSHLLSPTEIGSAVSDLSCLTTSSRGEVVKSWFSTSQRIATSVNSRKICSQYFKTSRAECTDLVSTQFKSRRIRIYPTKEQRTILRRWFGVQRLVYNQAIQHYKDKEFEVRHWMKLYAIVFFGT